MVRKPLPDEGQTFDALSPYAPSSHATPEESKRRRPRHLVPSLPIRSLLTSSSVSTVLSIACLYLPNRFEAATILLFAIPLFTMTLFSLNCITYYEKRGAEQRSNSWKVVHTAMTTAMNSFLFATMVIGSSLVITFIERRWIGLYPFDFLRNWFSFSIAYPVTLIYVAHDLRVKMPKPDVEQANRRP